MTIRIPDDPTRRPLHALQGNPRNLEVRHYWDGNLLDVQHHAPGSTVTAGGGIGWHWSVLGRSLGFVPPMAAKVLPFAPPLLSQVAAKPTADVVVPDDHVPGPDPWNLVSWEQGAFRLRVPADWTLALVRDEAGEAEVIAEHDVEVDPGQTWLMDTGVSTLLIRRTPEADKLVAPVARPEQELVASATLMMGLAAVLVAWVQNAPPRLNTDGNGLPDRFVQLILQEEPPVEKKIEKRGAPDEPGAKAPREEGKRGEQDAPLDKAKGDPVKIKKQEMDRQIAENAGLLGAMSDMGEMSGIFGSSGLSSDLTGAVGGLIGVKGAQRGSGLGSRGMGFGGGGDADIGAIGLGTQGRGAGTDYGTNGDGLGTKIVGELKLATDQGVIVGALDRADIEAVIKRHLSQIRYCYQRELQRDPDLSGKITMGFTIAKDGSVAKAGVSTSTLNSAAVDQCIESRFYRMQFPEPRGGGIVVVKYPFLFSPG